MENAIRIGIMLSLMVSIGCNQTTPVADNADPSTDGVTAEEATPRETIGKTTQNVLNLDEALGDGAVLASTSITSNNPLLVSAEAYRTSVGKLGGMSVEKAIQIRNAQSIRDPQPLTLEELMAEIIKKGKFERHPSPDAALLPGIRLGSDQSKTGRRRLSRSQRRSGKKTAIKATLLGHHHRRCPHKDSRCGKIGKKMVAIK